MMRDLHPVVSLSLLLGFVAATLWIFAEVARRYAARGTRPRWYWAGVERSLRYPAGYYLSMSTLLDLRYHQWLTFLCGCVGVALWLLLLLEKKRDGEDEDFWSDVAKKVHDLLSPGTSSATGTP